MSAGTIITGPQWVFQKLNEKSLCDDLIFYFAIVAAASVLFTMPPLLTEEAPEIGGLHRTWFIVAGTLITLTQGLITGAVALPPVAERVPVFGWLLDGIMSVLHLTGGLIRSR
jgi:hypothetical protein